MIWYFWQHPFKNQSNQNIRGRYFRFGLSLCLGFGASILFETLGYNNQYAIAATKCPAENISKSISGKLATDMVFVNLMPENVKVYWLNYSGQRQFYKQLQPGESYKQSTYVTHPWVVTGMEDNCLGVYYPDSLIRVVSIRGVGKTSNNSSSSLLKDTLILPGVRVGPITVNSTRRDLVSLFGESRLTDTTMLVAEGTQRVPITKVNLGKESSFTVTWTDNRRQKISWISDFGSAWKTPEGISTGTTFKQLRRTLGEFKLTGLGWDYGGFVNLSGTKLAKYQGQLSIRVDANYETAQKYPNQLTKVSGDQELSSTNPNWNPLDVRVSELTVTFNRVN